MSSTEDATNKLAAAAAATPSVAEEEEEAEAENVVEQGEDTVVPFLHSGRDVVYCPMCGLPPEYCEYNTKSVFNRCKPWLLRNYPDLYPQLKKEAEKKRRRRPKGTFYRWPEIGLFYNVRARITEPNQPEPHEEKAKEATGEKGEEDANKDKQKEPKLQLPSSITYRAKIKLHGTNGAISIQHNGNDIFVQSRNKFLTKEKDHHGFAEWALHKDRKAYFKSLYKQNAGYKSVTVFGEWCGKGIMRGAAICNVDQRMYAVFALLLDKSKLIVAPDQILSFLQQEGALPMPQDLIVLPWFPSLSPSYASKEDEEAELIQVQMDFASSEGQLIKEVDRMNVLVENVDKEDPWVKSRFGVSGSGEGLVWYPVSFPLASEEVKEEAEQRVELSPDLFQALSFKTKGPTHSVIAGKKSVQLSPELVESAEQFLDLFFTEARLRQGWEEVIISSSPSPSLQQEVNNNTGSKTHLIGEFVEWICNDVRKESKQELEQNGLTWEQVSGMANIRARKWFLAEINRHGGVVVHLPSASPSPSST
ncbi:Translation machinery-associated protein 22 [Balamuthia mandrillaris]